MQDNRHAVTAQLDIEFDILRPCADRRLHAAQGIFRVTRWPAAMRNELTGGKYRIHAISIRFDMSL